MMRCLLLATLALIRQAPAGAKIGFSLGTGQMKHPLEPHDAARLLAQAYPGTEKVKLFDFSEAMVDALRSEGIMEATVCVAWNDKVKQLANEPSRAAQIVERARRFADAGMQLTLAVGNEPYLKENINAFHVVPAELVRAVENVRDAIYHAGLGGKVRFTVPFQMTNFVNFPPRLGQIAPDGPTRDGAIRPEGAAKSIAQVARMILDDGGKFSCNMYPYQARISDPQHVALGYAIGQAGHGFTDEFGDYHPSLLQAMHQTVEAALQRAGCAGLALSIGEAGWATAGGLFPEETSVQNAATFAKSFAESGLDGFLFEAYDEQNKASHGTEKGGEVENHWGALTERGDAKYPIPGLSGTTQNTHDSYVLV